MTRRLAILVGAAVCGAQLASAQPPTDAPAAPRAPLAVVADVEPAVDVGNVEGPPRAGTPGVIDSLDLGTTSITGNQELPKVLYIVPWKRSALGDPVARPVNSLLDEVLAPIEPEVFERELGYYESLFGNSQEE